MIMRAILLAIFVTGCAAREPARPPPPEPSTAPRAGGIEAQLFSAELVMDHQAALGLSDAQSGAIRGELARAQAELVEVEWALRAEREALATILATSRVDEEAAMTIADRVLEREAAIKRIHLRLLIRIKSQLRPEQQARLDSLR
ncbi:MAG: periplasmic heavy metal sensor [Sandaracinaceae bacterium]|nr:periplasmic heavy metal sensor [Sandaracinaceae bacterium]